MKIVNMHSTQTVTIHGCDIQIPAGTRFVTINAFGQVEAWKYDAPTLDLGMWECEGECATFIGRVELEDDEQWTKPFDVDHNNWYESYNY